MEKETIQKNSEIKETTEKVVNSDVKLHKLHTLSKNLTYNITDRIVKKIKYIVETKEQTRKRKERESTKLNKKLFLEYYRKSMGSVMAISKKIGIERKTFYNWMRSDDEFRENYNEAKQDLLDDTEDALIHKIRKGDAGCIKFFLKSKHPDYKPSLKIEDIRPQTTFKDFMDAINDKINEDDKNTTNKTGDDNKPKDGEKGVVQNMDDRKPVQDKKQEGGVSEVRTESGTKILPEEKKEEKHNPKS